MVVSDRRLWSEPGGKSHLPLGSIFGYLLFTMSAIADTQKKRGRPPTGRTAVMVKLLPEELTLLDEWITAQGGHVSRPEALRRILKLVAVRMPD